MTGVQESVWARCPPCKCRLPRHVWFTVKRATGAPPTVLEYKPAMRWDDSGEEPIFRRNALWVVHHERGTFRFTGSAKKVVEEIEVNGFPEGIQSIKKSEGDGIDGRNTDA